MLPLNNKMQVDCVHLLSWIKSSLHRAHSPSSPPLCAHGRSKTSSAASPLSEFSSFFFFFFCRVHAFGMWGVCLYSAYSCWRGILAGSVFCYSRVCAGLWSESGPTQAEGETMSWHSWRTREQRGCWAQRLWDWTDHRLWGKKHRTTPSNADFLLQPERYNPFMKNSVCACVCVCVCVCTRWNTCSVLLASSWDLF